MLRMMGAVLLIGGTGAVGIGRALKLRREAGVLRQLAGAAGELQREIALRKTPMPELLRRMETATREPVRRLFSRTGYLLDELGNRSFSLLWSQAAEETLGGVLSDEALTAVEEVGIWLGRFDAQQQAEALERTRRQLDELYGG